MKNNLNEELNRLKFLLGYKPGQLMTESQVKETYLSEQSRGFRRTPEPTNTPQQPFDRQADLDAYERTREAPPSITTRINTNQGVQNFEVDFSNYPQDNTITTKQVRFFDKIGYLKIDSNIVRFKPPKETKTIIPGYTKEKTIIPKFEYTTIQGQSFRDNFIGIDKNVTNSLIQNARELNKTFREIYQLKPTEALENIKKFLNRGFELEGHADGNIPSATRLNQTDHANFGNGQLYGGNTTPNSKNTWLAEQRARNAYNIFMKELSRLLKTTFYDNSEIIELITNILTIGGGYTTLNVVDHLNQNGTRNSREIGPEYKRFEFKPTFKTNIPIPISTFVPPTEKIEVEKGDEVGNVSIYLYEYNQDILIPGMVYFDNNLFSQNDKWVGVTKDVLEKYKIPILSDGKLNGSPTHRAMIDENMRATIGDLQFGTFDRKRVSDATNLAQAAGPLIHNTTINSARKVIEGVTYYKVSYANLIISTMPPKK
jgi:hypothetical protein